MMEIKTIAVISAAISCALLAACGGDSAYRAEPSGSSSAQYNSGMFIDAPVQGLCYSDSPSGLIGTTSAGGGYQFITGDTVTFWIDASGTGCQSTSATSATSIGLGSTTPAANSTTGTATATFVLSLTNGQQAADALTALNIGSSSSMNVSGIILPPNAVQSVNSFITSSGTLPTSANGSLDTFFNSVQASAILPTGTLAPTFVVPLQPNSSGGSVLAAAVSANLSSSATLLAQPTTTDVTSNPLRFVIENNSYTSPLSASPNATNSSTTASFIYYNGSNVTQISSPGTVIVTPGDLPLLPQSGTFTTSANTVTKHLSGTDIDTNYGYQNTITTTLSFFDATSDVYTSTYSGTYTSGASSGQTYVSGTTSGTSYFLTPLTPAMLAGQTLTINSSCNAQPTVNTFYGDSNSVTFTSSCQGFPITLTSSPIPGVLQGTSANGYIAYVGLIGPSVAAGSQLVFMFEFGGAFNSAGNTTNSQWLVTNQISAVTAPSPTEYTVGGSVSGLNSGEQVVLTNNGGNALTVSSNGAFSFTDPVPSGLNYLALVNYQPPGQSCTVSNGSGIGISENVTNISVSCVASTESILFSFNPATNGGSYSPDSGGGISPILANDGNFYGTGGGGATVSPGISVGAIYKMTPAGVASVLYTFRGGTSDGEIPFGLIQGRDGNFYGVTWAGGTYNHGVFYQVTPAGVETVLYNFGAGGPNDAQAPSYIIEGSDGNFYGSGAGGAYGKTNCTFGYLNGSNTFVCVGYGDGTIFKVTPTGQETVLYSFGANLGDPQGSTPLIQASDGNLYGISPNGGMYGGTNCPSQYAPTICGDGTVFRITLTGDLTVIYNFGGQGSEDATNPATMVLGNDGNFYALANGGGANGTGAVVKFNVSGAESVLYSYPVGSTAPSNNQVLVQGKDGNLYGVSCNGGTNSSPWSNGAGTLFEVTQAGVGTTLYNFGATNADGFCPSGLVIGSNGSLYGVTQGGGAGGSSNDGTFFVFGHQ